MSGTYYRTAEMSEGKPFRCYNCGKLLLDEVLDAYRLRLTCPRCKTRITLETLSPVPSRAAAVPPASTVSPSREAMPVSAGHSK